ncbi:MAG: glycosyltransferase family 4 protein [Dissulfurispiraceae bacterium]|jgi:UDP-glucose:(heptosyl)LPS alpha-1,3-glucosyltransferase|nr:glycosyltransferase family 4 protein [Dissulfurispiraceae bacterium]
MKVAMLIRCFVTTGGAERYAVEVASRLAKKCELHVFAQEIGIEPPGIIFHKLSRIAQKPRYINQMHFSLQTANLRSSFDVIHSHERVNDFDVFTIHCPTFKGGYLGGLSTLAYWWKSTTHGLSPRNTYYLCQEAKQFRKVAGRRFLAVSQHVMKDVINHYPLNETDFDIAYPGVDLDKFSPVSEYDKISARKRFGLKEDDLVVCFVGTEFERKGLGTLIKAMGLLKGSPLRLLVAGGGNSKSFLNMALCLGIKDKVHFAGMVSDVKSIYEASDLYVLPTLSDPCPMAPLEAMACGLPVVVSNAQITGVAEHMQHGEAVLLNDPEDEIELADALRILQDPILRREYSSRGLSLVEQITWDETAHQTFLSYERSIKERRKGLGC